MSVRTKVLALVDVMMRVPPIMVIDKIFKMGMGLPRLFYPAATGSVQAAGGEVDGHFNISSTPAAAPAASSALLDVMQAAENISLQAAADGVIANIHAAAANETTFLGDALTVTTIKFLACFLALMAAAGIFMLWTRQLAIVYIFVASIMLPMLSYWLNVTALESIAKSPCILDEILALNFTSLFDTSGVAVVVIPNLLLQWYMGSLFAYMNLSTRFQFYSKLMPVIFAGPLLLSLLPVPPHILKHAPIVANVIPLTPLLVMLMIKAVEVCKTVYNGYQYAMNFVSNFGLSALIENEWQRLNVPSVLRVFWTIRIGIDLLSTLIANDASTLAFLPTMQNVLVGGCDTLTAVLGMTAVISLLCHYIGKAFQWYLLAVDNDEEKSLGTVSAVLFYILALQTGLTSLAPEKRFERLCRNLCLLVTALLHFLHNIVSPILMSLGASLNPSLKRHVRALTVCAFLILAPISLLAVLWSRNVPSTWLLAVSAFSVEVVVKVLVSLATYALFLLDARRPTFWEKLDDYLYYVRAFGNSVEFCFGILLFFNGAWIMIFESGGAIRAIMMCIHAYFNIWCEARTGWTVFMKRRMAVHKISSLPEATSEQLRAFDDVCAICYQEMFSAKITRCRHYFHGVCLRKWLYVQDRCPLCHEIMMHTDKSDENGSNEALPPEFPPERNIPHPAENQNDTLSETGSADNPAPLSGTASAASLAASVAPTAAVLRPSQANIM